MDLNVDMGESFGRYELGNDEEVMKYITSANIACGFHASDPNVMEETVELAKLNNVSIGAHTGLPDKQGFGRRRLDITPEELKNDTLYQLGALDGFLKAKSMNMQHVKPHGILYRMIADDEKYAKAFLDAVSLYNTDLYIFTPKYTLTWDLGKEKGLNMVAEILVDLNYDDDGNWALEHKKKAWSPEEVSERAIMVATENKITTINGNKIDVEADTICCHGDSPNAVDTVKLINEKFKKLNIPLVSLS